MYRTILLARVLDQKIWGLNRMGKAAFVVSRPGPRGRAGRLGLGAAGRARRRAALLPRHRRDAHARHDRRARSCSAVFARADDPNSRRPADAEPLGLARAAT